MRLSHLNRHVLSVAQVVGALLLCATGIYIAEAGVDIKWIVICGFTLIYFGFVCYHLREFWLNPWYWAAFLGALLVHSVVVILLQRNRPMLPGLYYGAIGAIESICLCGLLLRLFFR